MAGPHHLVRNPVFDASQQVAAYELRGRPHASSEAEAGALLQAVQSPGLIHLVGGHDLLLPLPGAFLFQEFDNLLPSKQIILLVPAPESGQEGLEEAIACRRKEGFRIGFEVANVERVDRDVLRHADFLRFDLQDFGDLSALTTAAAHLRAMEAPWVVQGLNSRDEVQQCQALGFSLFQGLFFTEPAVFSTDPVQPRQAALLEIFRKLGEGAEFDEIERTFKAYPDLCLQLLDLLNSAAFRRNEPIYSIRQALVLLGMSSLRKWVALLLFADNDPQSNNPLFDEAVLRGRILEGAAARIQNSDSFTGGAFLVGIFSVISALLMRPLDQLIRELNLDRPVASALRHRQGALGELLSTLEQMRENQPLPATVRIGEVTFQDQDWLDLEEQAVAEVHGQLLPSDS